MLSLYNIIIVAGEYAYILSSTKLPLLNSRHPYLFPLQATISTHDLLLLDGDRFRS